MYVGGLAYRLTICMSEIRDMRGCLFRRRGKDEWSGLEWEFTKGLSNWLILQLTELERLPCSNWFTVDLEVPKEYAWSNFHETYDGQAM